MTTSLRELETLFVAERVQIVRICGTALREATRTCPSRSGRRMNWPDGRKATCGIPIRVRLGIKSSSPSSNPDDRDAEDAEETERENTKTRRAARRTDRITG